MTDKYILKGHEAVPCNDLLEWAKTFETLDRHVGSDEIGEVRISTVFLGLDHNWFGEGPPLLFETMIFGGPHNDYQERCSTWDEALIQHKTAVDLVKASLQ